MSATGGAHLGQDEIRRIALQALDKVIEAPNDRLLVWDHPTNMLKVMRPAAKSAAKWLANPCCLGLYNDSATLEIIIADLEDVLNWRGLQVAAH